MGCVVYLLWLQPPFYFPKPTGSCSVGAKIYHWVDSTRKEIYSTDPAHPYRELMVKIWYPAKPSPLGGNAEKPSAPYVRDLFAHLKKTKPLIWLLSGASRQMFTYERSSLGVAGTKPRYPIIIFSPGSGGSFDSNSVNCQELASQGYVVVGISHTYESRVVKVPDGRIIIMIDVEQGKNFIERRKQNDKGIVEEGVADVRFVLDQLKYLAKDQQSIFYDRFDLERIGMFGQSRGGAISALMCRLDQRVKVGVDMDGSLFGPDATKPIDKPFMFLLAGDTVKLFDGPMSKESWKAFCISSPQEEQMVRERYLLGFEKIAAGKQDKYIFVVNGAGHIDLTDNALLIKYAAPVFSRPLIKLVFVGPFGYGSIDGLRVTEIVNAYLVNFFNKYLKGQSSVLLNGGGKGYTEVEKIITKP